MKSLLPYPVLALGLVVIWLLLSGFTRGQFILALIVGISASHALKSLGEESPKVRRWLAIPELMGVVLYDVVRSNLAVAGILLSGKARPRQAGFVLVPLRTTNPSALAILAIVLTCTPGTAWLDYNSARSEVLIHVFDLVEEQEWRDLISTRYERLLLEIFG